MVKHRAVVGSLAAIVRRFSVRAFIGAVRGGGVAFTAIER